MTITITVVAVATLVHVTMQGYVRALMHGYTWVCASYLLFFWRPPSDDSMAVVVDAAVALSFGSFSWAFLAFHHLGRVRSRWLMRAALPVSASAQPMSPAAVIILSCVPVLFALLTLYVRTRQAGSVEQALWGLYSVRLSRESIWLARLLGPAHMASLGSLLLLRIEALLWRRRGVAVLSWLTYAVLLAAALVTGTRGRLVVLLVVFLVADALAIVRSRMHPRPRPVHALAAVVTLLLAIVLTHVRGQAGTLDRLQQAVAAVLDEGAMVAARSSAGAGNVSDNIAFSLSYYGESKQFLHFYSLWAVVCNIVPRELWPDKPVGFGKVLAEARGFRPENPTSLAAGLAGEGYANGGWAGIVLLSLLAGAVSGFSSGVAYGGFEHGGRAHIVLSLALLVFSRLFVRGDILSAWVYMYSVIGLGVLVRTVAMLVSRRSSRPVLPHSDLGPVRGRASALMGRRGRARS